MSYDNIDDVRYKILYKRYLKRPVKELLLAGGSIKGKDIIDVCAGTMRLSEEAMRLECNRIWAIERSKSMVPNKFKKHHQSFNSKLQISYVPLESVYVSHGFVKYDMAFCQQGINYWFSEDNLKLLCSLLKRNGKFIFNTFNTKPSKKPVTREYDISGRHYCEVYQAVGSMIYHLQMCDTLPPHYTEFKWISPQYFDKILHKIFKEVDCKIDGPTSIYVCIGKRNV